MPGAKAPAQQRVQAIAVKDGRILTVGTNDEIKKLHGGKTKTVDLGGKFVMPGFNDTHLHLANGGFEKLNVNLIGAKSVDEMKTRVAERARTAAAGERVPGRGLDHTPRAGPEIAAPPNPQAVTRD